MKLSYLQNFECLGNWKGAAVEAEICSMPLEPIVSAVSWRLVAEPIYKLKSYFNLYPYN